MKLREIAPGVKLKPNAIVHPTYHVDGVPYDCTVQGISTWALSECFMGGDSPDEIAADYAIDRGQVFSALRWQLLPRATRLAHVRRMARRIP